MGEAAGVLQAVLHYFDVPIEDARDFLNSLNELVLAAVDLLQQVRRQPGRGDGFSASAPAYFSDRLPNFFQENFRSLIILEYGKLSCVRLQQHSRTLEQVLQDDLALLRHVTDFMSDIAKWGQHGDDLVIPDQPFSLYPACDIEHEQAFWKSHQEQVRDTDRLLFLSCLERALVGPSTRITHFYHSI